MKRYQEALLAGVAALALLAGTGVASAQQQEHPGAAQQHPGGTQPAQPHAAQPQMNQPRASAPSAPGHNMGQAHPGTPNRSAQSPTTRSGSPAEHTQTPNRATGPQHPEGNATGARPEKTAPASHNAASHNAGGNVHFTAQQRTRVRESVLNRGPHVGHVNFDVRVGTVIPRGNIEIVAVPEYLVQIQPEWRGFLYFVYEDEVVIVDPNTYAIVAVVAV